MLSRLRGTMFKNMGGRWKYKLSDVSRDHARKLDTLPGVSSIAYEWRYFGFTNFALDKWASNSLTNDEQET